MDLIRYTGYTPVNAKGDASYSVVPDGSTFDVRLRLAVDGRNRYDLRTDEHDALADMVNAVKRAMGRQSPGGRFYINEFSDVLVPDGNGGLCYWAGKYTGLLEFRYAGRLVSPEVPLGVEPGDVWPGPHVGIPYVLSAGGTEIKYEKRHGDGRKETILLSDEADPSDVARLASRLAEIKGTTGGRIYINERCNFFTNMNESNPADFIFLGSLDEDPWFQPPDEFSE